MLDLHEKLKRALPQPGKFLTAIDGLTLFRGDVANRWENYVYRPGVGIVVQGALHSLIGQREYRCDQGSCVVVGADRLVVGHIAEASPARPFLALSVPLDRFLVTQLAAEISAAPIPDGRREEGIATAPASPEIYDAFLRLIRLLETPVREIHYYLFCGPYGGYLRRVSTQDAPGRQIAQAIAWLHDHYHEALPMAALARKVGMAESTFYRRFRQVTALSPLQFQKRLRLHEAQRLMCAEAKDAATAAFTVGYESAAQFSREYKRCFGAAPHQDVVRRRQMTGLAPAPHEPT